MSHAIPPENKIAYTIYEELITRLHQQGYLFLKIGKILTRIRDEKLYEKIGEGGYDTFQQFLASPEIALKKPTAYMYIRIYEFYAQKMQMTDEEIVAIPSYKLLRLLPILKDKTKEEVVKVIDDIHELGTADTEIVIREQGLDPYDRPRVYRCPACNKWVVRYDEKSICQCDGTFHLINEKFEGKE
jgi:hypothetical protein